MNYFILSDSIRLRFEPTGGLLLNRDRQETKHFNHSATALLSLLCRPRTAQEIKEAIPSIGGEPLIKDFLREQCEKSIVRRCDHSATTNAEIYSPIEKGERSLHLSSPIGVELELTLKCMRSCRYCAYDAHPKARTSGELSLGEWRAQLREFYEAGIFFIRLTGGDPLTRPDFAEILRTADDMGFVITVGSDLTYLNDEVLHALSEAKNLYALQTTLDGSKPELADLLRGPGNFESVIKGIKQLKHADVPVILGTVINRKNFNDIENIASLAGSLGVDGYCVGPLYSAGRGTASALRTLVPTNDDLTTAARAFQRAIAKDVVRPADPAWMIATPELENDELDQLWHDQGYLVRRPDTLIRVDPFGKVYASIKLKPILGDEAYLGDIRSSHILDIWHHSPGLDQLRETPSNRSYFGPVIDVRQIVGGENGRAINS